MAHIIYTMIHQASSRTPFFPLVMHFFKLKVLVDEGMTPLLPINLQMKNTIFYYKLSIRRCCKTVDTRINCQLISEGLVSEYVSMRYVSTGHEIVVYKTK